MAASTETQRLISVSLGKIAQSRGQRGGINLHKNLLVATVLHKARTAYMMESYHYNKQKQCNQEQIALQHQQQMQVSHLSHGKSFSSTTTLSGGNPQSDKGEVCQAARDSNLGQAAATPAMGEGNRSEISAQQTVSDVLEIHEPMTFQENNEPVVYDKENSPPTGEDRLGALETSSGVECKSPSVTPPNHLYSATQLSLDAQLASSDSCPASGKQAPSTNANTTCNVLKRRRDNPSTNSTDYECPVSKKARVSLESPYFTVASNNDLNPDISELSSDDSDSEPDAEAMYTSETPQISNLVSIFNSGFSGLCAVSGESDLSSSGCHQSDLDISSLSKMRPDSHSPAYSRKMSEAPLLCSTQVGRLESLPSAIVLSA